MLDRNPTKIVNLDSANKGIGFLRKNNKFINLQFKTIHSSKGLTFDFVLLDDVSISKLGFPSNVMDDSILKLFLNNLI